MGGVTSTGLHKPRKLGTKKSTAQSDDTHMPLYHNSPSFQTDDSASDVYSCDSLVLSPYGENVTSLHHSSNQLVHLCFFLLTSSELIRWKI